MLGSVLSKLQGVVFIRYFALSLLALAVDVTCLAALSWGGVPPFLATALAYCMGIAAHWVLVSRAVFHNEVSHGRAQRNRQKALFVLSSFVGLAVTSFVVKLALMLSLGLAAAKVLATGFSFFTNWLVRRYFIFPTRQVSWASLRNCIFAVGNNNG